jgi:hypothetical protein
VGKAAELPNWIKPQLTRNVDEAPAGDDWLHEIKYAGLAALANLGACTCPVSEPPEATTAADAPVKDAAYCAELGRLHGTCQRQRRARAGLHDTRRDRRLPPGQHRARYSDT